MGKTTPTEFYPGQTFEADGIRYRVVADPRNIMALEIFVRGRGWHSVDVEDSLSLSADFLSQHGTAEEKALAETIYAKWPYLRPRRWKWIKRCEWIAFQIGRCEATVYYWVTRNLLTPPH